MEVADQWRREWAGSAEYGKVTEGGVTRRIARAMEVLNASGPGARVRVMRAAYHSSAGPGVPASSYMVHSSRRVISSGYNFLEPPSLSSLPSLPTKPMEISSTPLESFPVSNTDTEKYKVTEPDDIEISEPSKWRGSTGTSSIRMPSEESSSTADNASIIDLDSRTTKNLQRKYSYDSESSDVPWSKRNNPRASPLLDAPVTLNTLKYKSLLNGSSEWNNRRKSYSFEDTSPINETMLHQNDTLALESSTDSGICKSSEIVNDHNIVNDSSHSRHSERKERKNNTQDESFKEWLFKNRSNTFYKGTKFKTYREHDIVIEDPVENSITLQSTGKVSITLPIAVETEEAYQQRKLHMNDDGQRKAKKVEFCKTELHFAAESGKVNIIATDEKPPPSNDFRKRRSAFVPLHEMIEKPITLFGEKNYDLAEPNLTGELLNINNSEFGEFDENTAATKSILKNKIPKPKPYLLGENMAFGSSKGVKDNDQSNNDSPVLTAVSLINKQLQSERRLSDDISSMTKEKEKIINKSNAFRTIDNGPAKNYNSSTEKHVFTVKSQSNCHETIDVNHVNTVKQKFNVLQMSPVQSRPKTRQLRESELTYFGVDNDREEPSINKLKYNEKGLSSDDSAIDDLFHSVRLIRKISNSVCNSEAESEDAPEYQNVPLRLNYAPVPTPRLRSKYDDKPNEIEEIHILKPIIENKTVLTQTNDNSKPTTRRSRLRRQEETTTPSNRSISEPPKKYRDSLEKSHRQHYQLRGKNYHTIEDDINENLDKMASIKKTQIQKNVSKINDPLYANLGIEPKSRNQVTHKRELSPRRTLQRESKKTDREERKGQKSHKYNEEDKVKPVSQENTENDTLKRKQHASNKDNNVQQVNKDEKNLNCNDYRRNRHDESCSTRASNKCKNNNCTNERNNTRMNQDLKSRSSQRHSTNSYVEGASTPCAKVHYRKISTEKNPMKHVEENSASSNRRSSNEKEKASTRHESPKALQKLDPNTTEYSLKPMHIKSNERHKTNRDLNGKVSHRTPRRNEYVINYDDKNGTVSSVRKIQPVPGETSRKKKLLKESIKESPKENVALKNKTINKIALLQLADHPRTPNGMSNANRKWKTKVHVQRSCQLL